MHSLLHPLKERKKMQKTPHKLEGFTKINQQVYLLQKSDLSSIIHMNI
uniref:Uncharacterized protein n=1 Tax=Arundo donax TaxID=35708 RepID=A0A0A9AXD4_ARUDO